MIYVNSYNVISHLIFYCIVCYIPNGGMSWNAGVVLIIYSTQQINKKKASTSMSSVSKAPLVNRNSNQQSVFLSLQSGIDSSVLSLISSSLKIALHTLKNRKENTC